MKNLAGTQTEKNLRAALAGESQARNNYTYYTDIAKMEGNLEAAEFFEKTAENERFHAKAWYKLLNNDALPDTIGCLERAIKGENFEQTSMYPTFAKTAKEEGLDQIATLFNEIAKIEKSHEEQAKLILENIKNKNKDGYEALELQTDMICVYCGFEFHEDDNLQQCPVCEKPSTAFAHKMN